MDGPVLTAESLSLHRGRRRIYEDLHLSFDVGVTALLGPNGAGKTTLIEGLLAPERAAQGRVLFRGQAVPSTVPLREFLSKVGHMPQAWAFYSGFTALETVEYMGWLKGLTSSQARAAAVSALAWVDLTAQQDVRVRRLSGGMRQRVGLAETFVNNPEVVLLDEPTVGLDPAQRAMFRDFIRSRSTDRAIVISTHLTDDVAVLADRVVVVDAGRVVFDGTVDQLTERAGPGDASASAIEAGYLAVIGAAVRGGQG
ncbi:ATP-binding cassette domain-containing protein [uncultured Amnibacterium sp.]|uniref:ATP-binding cassette domain-containing protein n=1 Tax=uncultured Amnibacterium sp. TaxID=1631851 RepID=UPI0035CA176B